MVMLRRYQRSGHIMAKCGGWVLVIALATVTPAMAQTNCFTVYPAVPPADCFHRVAPTITPPVVERPTTSAPPVAVAPAAPTDDPRCDAPPYGSTEPDFEAFVQVYGGGQDPILKDPVRTFRSICIAKHIGGEPRRGLINLGFTDEEIDTTTTAMLASEAVTRIAEWARKYGPAIK